MDENVTPADDTTTPVESIESLAAAYADLDAQKESIEAKMKALKATLVERMPAEGKSLRVNGVIVSYVPATTRNGLDQAAAKAALEKAGLPVPTRPSPVAATVKVTVDANAAH